MDDFNLRYRLSKVLLQNETILTRIKAILKEDFCDYYAIIVEKYSYLLNKEDLKDFQKAGRQSINYIVERLLND